MSAKPALPDHVAVQNLILRQKRAADGHDTQLLHDCYIPEFVLSVRRNGGPATLVHGRDEVLRTIQEGWDVGGGVVHLVGPAEILVDGDDAQAFSQCQYLSAETGATLGWGSYVDRLARRDGEWRLTHRELDATFLTTG